VRRIVDRRAAGETGAAVLEVSSPELAEGLARRLDLAALDRLHESAPRGQRRTSAREAAARGQRAVGLAEREAIVRAVLRFVRIDAVAVLALSGDVVAGSRRDGRRKGVSVGLVDEAANPAFAALVPTNDVAASPAVVLDAHAGS
jgi:hypothetical protein